MTLLFCFESKKENDIINLELSDFGNKSKNAEEVIWLIKIF